MQIKKHRSEKFHYEAWPNTMKTEGAAWSGHPGLKLNIYV